MKKASDILKERLRLSEANSEKHDNFDYAYNAGLKHAIEVIELWEKAEEPYKEN